MQNKSSRRRWRGLCLAVSLLLSISAQAADPAPAGKKPNIVFLLCDDLGYGDLGCFASPVIKTPNLDRLAAEGLKLTHCYASFPVCSPSRAGLLTGRNANRLGIYDWIPQGSGVFLRTNEITIARLLKSAGYHTAHIGKWHCISKFNGAEATPGDHGFDYWFSTQNNAVPSHEDPVNFVRNGKRVGPLKGNSSTLIMDEALQYLERTGKEPFLAMIWFHAPHEKISTPEEFTKKYPDVEDPTKRIYYGSVSLVDHEIGRLLKYLDDHNLRGNTLVVFTSDNGPETLRRYVGAERSHGSPGPLRGMKLHITEGGYRVPGIIRWPGHTRAGANSEEPVNNTDFLPTFCQIAGVEIPRDRVIDGASIVPVFSGQPIERQTPLYWEYDFAISTPWTISLRDGQWKLLGNATLDQFELYDLTADVGEAKNVATKFPARVAKMSAEMKRLHREIFEEGARSGNPLPARAVKK